MVGVILIFGLLTLIYILIYLPVIHQYFVTKQSEKKLIFELSLLDELFASCLMINTTKLGQGESHNSDIKFIEAQKNQDFAVNSILGMIQTTAER